MDRIGRYRIVREIGRGAMGIVYLATDPTIGRSVAIKTVRLRDVDNTAQRDKLRERLFREARSAGVLSHPNIVTIYDMAEEDGIAYIAMEYVDGPTLDAMLSSGKPLDSARLFSILRQTATALDFAHSKDIIHRDIKPANIMMRRDGHVKVTDFGIAKISTAAESFTVTGTLVGTPNYMSPEQVQGKEVTGRSDQFSLAVIGYEVLTGELPFPGEQLSTVVYKIVAEEPVSPQRLNPTLAPSIDGVLRKALSKKPANRYRSCAEFVGSLETTCAATKGWQPRMRGASLNMSTLSEAAPAALRPLPNLSGPQSSRSEPRRESRILPLAAAFLMVAGLFALLTWQGGEKTSAQPKPETSAPAPVPEPPPKQEPPPNQERGATTPEPQPTPAPSDSSAELRPPPETKPEPKPQTIPDKPVKPSPMRPPEPASPAPRDEPPRQAGKPQEISVATNPSGASVVVDGNGATCQTPCTLQVPPGMHSLSVRLDGFQEERREFRVGSDAQEIPLISLRRAAGTLMLSTVPSGATITINDKVQPQTTPAQISLPPGTYNVMVEKNGKRAVDRVEIRNGNTNFIKIPLE